MKFYEYPYNWEEVSASIRKRDGYACVTCGRSNNVLHVDHIKPLSRGGNNHPSNLQTLCEDCHKAKHPHMRDDEKGWYYDDFEEDFADKDQGVCIRCGQEISLDPDRPMCGECYSIWADYRNFDYEENFCHSCGKSAITTYRKPLCLGCFRILS